VRGAHLDEVYFPVMPAKPVPEGGSRGAGIQSSENCLDSRLSTLRSRATAEDGRGNDGCRLMTFYATIESIMGLCEQNTGFPVWTGKKSWGKVEFEIYPKVRGKEEMKWSIVET
jgi:hypothetical protein